MITFYAFGFMIHKVCVCCRWPWNVSMSLTLLSRHSPMPNGMQSWPLLGSAPTACNALTPASFEEAFRRWISPLNTLHRCCVLVKIPVVRSDARGGDHIRVGILSLALSPCSLLSRGCYLSIHPVVLETAKGYSWMFLEPIPLFSDLTPHCYYFYFTLVIFRNLLLLHNLTGTGR